MRKLATLLLVSLMLLLGVAPVAADPPQTWYDVDFEMDFLMVDCSVYGHDFAVWDHAVGHASEVGYFDQAGNLIRTLVQTQGTDHLYKSTNPGLFVASGPFRYLQHVTILSYDPNNPDLTLAEVRVNGTTSNIRLPDNTVIRRSGQEVEIVQGEPPNTVLIATTKSVGLTVFDQQAICAALAP